MKEGEMRKKGEHKRESGERKRFARLKWVRMKAGENGVVFPSWKMTTTMSLPTCLFLSN